MKSETITVGGGCFWCTQEIFQELKGVVRVEAGYSGGTVPHPTYEQVCTGTTGHTEVAQITFDPSMLGLNDLLKVFFAVHDPTTLDAQGDDVGVQYRSVIFCRTPEQKTAAEAVIAELTAAKAFPAPIVTRVEPFTAFYKAEGHHQDYYRDNPYQPYCVNVIGPKLAKFRKLFKDELRH